MPVIIVGLFVALLAGWLFAEARGGRTVRVSCGLLCMLLLIGALFFSSQRAALIEAQHNACFRLLGEALERQEFEKAKAAVQSYNNRDTSQHPTFQMIDVLTGKK